MSYAVIFLDAWEINQVLELVYHFETIGECSLHAYEDIIYIYHFHCTANIDSWLVWEMII